MKPVDSAFRCTKVPMRICPEPMQMKEQSVWMGSCFTEKLGPWLSGLRYPVLSNPFGVVYHPLVMEKLLSGNPEDFFPYNFERQKVWLNFLLGTPFFARDEQTLCGQISAAALKCREALERADWLVLTFGTAFLYHHSRLGMVGKCHKLPAGSFSKTRSTPEEIVRIWKTTIHHLRIQNPGLRVLLSLSPVRHSRDGLEENMVSKSILRLAIDSLCSELPAVYYFPAFEMMMDELRDYRFYESDLVHPSDDAVAFLRRQFSLRFLKPEEEQIRQLGEEIQRMEQHRPQADWSEEARRWRENLEDKRHRQQKLIRENTGR